MSLLFLEKLFCHIDGFSCIPNTPFSTLFAAVLAEVFNVVSVVLASVGCARFLEAFSAGWAELGEGVCLFAVRAFWGVRHGL